jgi:acyl-coenzyme A thioesterase PaaI-like protein
MMESKTHLAISASLVGEMVEIIPGKATARLKTTDEMAADERGLLHGGFTFGLADYAAMLAVNDPLVVLGGAEVRFLAAVRCGDELLATAELETQNGKKHCVRCYVESGGNRVFEGTFTCFVLDKPLLS